MEPASRSLLWWVSTTAAWLVLLCVGFVELFVEAVACDSDTSWCGEADERTERRGRVFTADGRPLPTRYSFVPDQNDVLHDEAERAEFRTDGEGRFCVELHDGHGFNAFRTDVRESRLPVDLRFRTPEARAALGRPDDGVLFLQPPPAGGEAGHLWIDAVDGAVDCERPGRLAPWYRYDDLSYSWQAILLKALPAAGVLLLLGVALTPLRHSPRARMLPGAGLALAAASVALFLLLWGAL